jgi:pimeloyl-ACP methyl ester carboxylesterase
MYCSGAGDPPVVFDSSGHTAGYRWVDLQPQIAKFTRACWYDRAGYGWSDPGPSPRTFRAVANDLHALMQVGAIPPPYVLVGEGLAGFHVRVYAGLYRREVAGVVLVDSAEVGPAGHEKGFRPGALGRLPPKVKALGCDIIGPALVRIGLRCLFSNDHGQQPIATTPLSAGQQAVFAARGEIITVPAALDRALRHHRLRILLNQVQVEIGSQDPRDSWRRMGLSSAQPRLSTSTRRLSRLSEIQSDSFR